MYYIDVKKAYKCSANSLQRLVSSFCVLCRLNSHHHSRRFGLCFDSHRKRTWHDATTKKILSKHFTQQSIVYSVYEKMAPCRARILRNEQMLLVLESVPFTL